MKQFAVICSFVVFFASIAVADQITMKDGDRITGSILLKDGDTLTVKSKNFGEIKIKWDDVADLRADEPLNVVLPGGQTVKETLRTQDGRIQVGTQTVPPSDITALRNDQEQRAYERMIHPGLLDLWVITGSLNIAGATGNAQTSTLTTPFTFVRASNTSRTSAYFNAIRSTATLNGVKSQTANAIRGGWSYDHDITKRIFFNAFNDNEYDKFQSLDLRVAVGGGIGYQILKRERTLLSVIAGVAWNREAYFASAAAAAFTRNSAEAFWGDDFTYKVNSRTNLTQTFRMFNNLSNTGQYRINADAVATTQLMKWLTWNFSLSDRYLTNPFPGRKTNDFLYSMGFGFSFAR